MTLVCSLSRVPALGSANSFGKTPATTCGFREILESTVHAVGAAEVVVHLGRDEVLRQGVRRIVHEVVRGGRRKRARLVWSRIPARDLASERIDPALGNDVVVENAAVGERIAEREAGPIREVASDLGQVRNIVA